MAPVSTSAIVLHTFRYGETSKIVRLATRDLGVQSAIAKGAMRENSRFGAKLETLSQGIAQLYIKNTRELQTLAEFEPTKIRRSLTNDVTRYAVAESLAELVLRFSPAEPNPQLYDDLGHSLDRLETVETGQLSVYGLGAIWRQVCELGYEPALSHCARDGRQVGTGSAHFSVTEGGVLCKRCAVGRKARRLPAEDRLLLESLIHGSADESTTLSKKRNAAHKRLLLRFVTQHLSEGREPKALSYWESLD